jgi:hypothetical protein
VHRSSAVPLATLAFLAACRGPGTGCDVLVERARLPDVVRETSGAAWSATRRDLWWTVPDDGEPPTLHAFDTTGREIGRVRVQGATVRDWEDLAAGPCGDVPGACLWIADIGDNGAVHGDVVIWRVPEPAPGDRVTAPAVRYTARYPDGARDAEAFAVVPRGDGTLVGIVVSKGRRTAIDVYTMTLRADSATTLVRGPRLAPQPRSGLDRVTGAATTPDGAWIAVRTYTALALYRRDALLAGGAPARTIPLGTLGERQGEAVALAADGRVLLTSEGTPARFSVLRCALR